MADVPTAVSINTLELLYKPNVPLMVLVTVNKLIDWPAQYVFPPAKTGGKGCPGAESVIDPVTLQVAIDAVTRWVMGAKPEKRPVALVVIPTVYPVAVPTTVIVPSFELQEVKSVPKIVLITGDWLMV